MTHAHTRSFVRPQDAPKVERLHTIHDRAQELITLLQEYVVAHGPLTRQTESPITWADNIASWAEAGVEYHTFEEESVFHDDECECGEFPPVIE
jgi:hypothetical protein